MRIACELKSISSNPFPLSLPLRAPALCQRLAATETGGSLAVATRSVHEARFRIRERNIQDPAEVKQSIFYFVTAVVSFMCVIGGCNVNTTVVPVVELSSNGDYASPLTIVVCLLPDESRCYTTVLQY